MALTPEKFWLHHFSPLQHDSPAPFRGNYLIDVNSTSNSQKCDTTSEIMSTTWLNAELRNYFVIISEKNTN